MVLLFSLVFSHGTWFVCLLRARLSSFVVVRFVVVVVGAAVPRGLLGVVVVVDAAVPGGLLVVVCFVVVAVWIPRCVCFDIAVVVVMLSSVVSMVVVMYVGVIACVY